MKKTYAALRRGRVVRPPYLENLAGGHAQMVESGRKYLPQLKTLPTDFVMRA